MNSAGPTPSSNPYGVPPAPRADWPVTFEKLHAIYSRRLYRTIVAITKNSEDAEDALQDTFLRAHLARETFEGRSSIYSWLTRIAINSALMVLRKRRVRPEVLFDIQPNDGSDATSIEVRDTAPNPEELCVLHQQQLKTLQALHRFRPHLREPIRMQVTRGWSIREISRELKISEAAVKSRIHRARQHLSEKHWEERQRRAAYSQSLGGFLSSGSLPLIAAASLRAAAFCALVSLVSLVDQRQRSPRTVKSYQ
jgi:RNA polymerase sigma-70 factor, ECF subfamily